MMITNLLSIAAIVIDSILMLILLYLLLIMPKLRTNVKKHTNIVELYAHRGLHNNEAGIPENSLMSFRRAVEAGFGIELDVQLTKDGVPVIFHDTSLERMCGIESRLDEKTYEELQQFTLLNTLEKIPTLAEFLETVSGKIPLIVELKAEWTDISVCSAAQALLDNYKGVYCIESFNPLVLLWYRKHRKHVVRGQLSTNFKKDGEQANILYLVLTHLLINWITKPDFIAYNCLYHREIGRRICKKLYRNMAVAWTVKSEKQLDNLKKEFDLFIFDSFVPSPIKNSGKYS